MATTMKGIIGGGGGTTFSASPATVNALTGSVIFKDDDDSTTKSIAIPAWVRVIKSIFFFRDGDAIADPVYIGVTPKTIHTLEYIASWNDMNDGYAEYELRCNTHSKTLNYESLDGEANFNVDAKIEWSPEINAHTPTITD